MPKGVKITTEYAESVYTSRGCVLLTKPVLSSSQKLRYVCTCGEIHERQFSHFLRGKNCMVEHLKERRISDDEIRSRFEQKGLTLIDEITTNAKHRRFRYICHCGRVAETILDDLPVINGCKDCRSDMLRMDFESVKQEFLSRGYILECGESDYHNNKSKLRFYCTKCKSHGEMEYRSITQGGQCLNCSRLEIPNKIGGDKSPHWNPNKTDEERLVERSYPEYKHWRTQVFERDEYSCVICHQHGGELNAHHIYNYADHPLVRLDLSNGATLCIECHIQFHMRYGKRFNTSEQFYEYKRLRQQQLGIVDIESEVS